MPNVGIKAMRNRLRSGMMYDTGRPEATCDITPSARGWLMKYLDPAGSVEMGRAVGEFSKIPDGTCTFSVDAEIRTIVPLSVPGGDSDDIFPSGSLGFVWSLNIYSFPMFRTGFVALASRRNQEPTQEVLADFAETLNNLPDYRAVADNNWYSLLGSTDWWYLISPLPPTFDLPDPVSGKARTLTSYRLSYKSLTVEHNAPTLVDQGFWIGGHYALDPQPIGLVMSPALEGVNMWLYVTTGSSLIQDYNLTIPQLVQQGFTPVGGNSVVQSSSEWVNIRFSGGGALAHRFSMVLDTGVVWYVGGAVWADSGDVISVSGGNTLPLNNGVRIFSSRAGTSSLAFDFPHRNDGQSVSMQIVADLVQGMERGQSQSIELPASTTDQIAANNPKIEQHLMHESKGAYVVHSKVRSPVFSLTPAGAFSAIQFSTPGFDVNRNHSDGTGIFDSMDRNMTTAVVAIRGIAHADVPVVKLYQGWEGLTNQNTPFGQFGHSGLPKCPEVMTLADNMVMDLTGVYPAVDNFLGAVSGYATEMLSKLLVTDANEPMIARIAKKAIAAGLAETRRRPQSQKSGPKSKGKKT